MTEELDPQRPEVSTHDISQETQGGDPAHDPTQPAPDETMDPSATDGDPDTPDEAPAEEGDDAVHVPGDGNEEPAEPGAGLGEEVEEPDPEEG